jgi:hypothetical protein
MQDFEAHAEALRQAESGLPTGLGGSPLADGQQDSDKLNGSTVQIAVGLHSSAGSRFAALTRGKFAAVP